MQQDVGTGHTVFRWERAALLSTADGWILPVRGLPHLTLANMPTVPQIPAAVAGDPIYLNPAPLHNQTAAVHQQIQHPNLVKFRAKLGRLPSILTMLQSPCVSRMNLPSSFLLVSRRQADQYRLSPFVEGFPVKYIV